MVNAIFAPAGAHAPRMAHSDRAVLAVFMASLFLSALLLFVVQPLFAKMILPRLGGAPSVWAVSLCFFQAVLLAGYCYAHLLNRLFSQRGVLLAHSALLASAALTLPVGLPAGAEPRVGEPYFWLLGVLALGVGVPFFAVSANAPLLQSWFARSGHPHAADPYFLYGASNFGSLIALLAYPVALEPAVGVSMQARVWTGGFVLLALLIAACGALSTARNKPATAATSENDNADATSLVWSQRTRWAVLAFVPSGLLVAFTGYLTADIASVPFLWVMPLALFLATFILAFRERSLLPHRLLLKAQPLMIAGALLAQSALGGAGWLLTVATGFGAFFVTAMVCHRELYDSRPTPRHLTDFYMWMSLGGVLGGIFAALVAPQVFNAIYELPILLILGLACRPGVAAALADRGEITAGSRSPLMLLVVVTAVALCLALFSAPDILHRIIVLPPLAVAALLMLANRELPFRLLAHAAVGGLTLLLLPSALSRGTAERSFFGIHRVLLEGDGSVRVLMHGTTIHGAERIRDKSGNLVAYPVPSTYFYPRSPLARGVAAARQVNVKLAGGLVVGIVGLGAGSMSCHSRPDETWRFYEIDPVVVRIAHDVRQFTFLSRCRPSTDIVLGDARLSLAREPAGRFDYLIIDAFSSDAIPVHLLTREAIALFLHKLAPDGILALHISNRHLDLPCVAAATALSVPGTFVALVIDRPEFEDDGAPSDVIFVTRSARAIAPILAWSDSKQVTEAEIAPWTDDYSNVPSAIWRRYFRGFRWP
jgi:hypothetical protein